MAEINGGDTNHLHPSWGDPPSTKKSLTKLDLLKFLASHMTGATNLTVSSVHRYIAIISAISNGEWVTKKPLGVDKELPHIFLLE